MDFTREPVIETIITPKEGHKLLIRSTINNQEEHSVDVVEVVSFGTVFFFRSLEKPKIFLLPMTQYEVMEIRKVRAVLKKPQVEKNHKVGEGKKVVETTTKEEPVEEEGKKHERKRMRKHRNKVGKKESTEEKELSVRYTLVPPPTTLISEQISKQVERYKHYLVEHGALLTEEKEVTAENKNGSCCSLLNQNNCPSSKDSITNKDKIVEKTNVSVKDKKS